MSSIRNAQCAVHEKKKKHKEIFVRRRREDPIHLGLRNLSLSAQYNASREGRSE